MAKFDTGNQSEDEINGRSKWRDRGFRALPASPDFGESHFYDMSIPSHGVARNADPNNSYLGESGFVQQPGDFIPAAPPGPQQPVKFQQPPAIPSLGPQPGMRPGALPPMGYGNPVQAPGQQTVRPGGSQSFARRSPDLVPAQGVPVQQPGALEGPQRQFVQGSKLRPRGTSPVDPMQQGQMGGGYQPQQGGAQQMPLIQVQGPDGQWHQQGLSGRGAQQMPYIETMGPDGKMHGPPGEARLLGRTMQPQAGEIVGTPDGAKWIGAKGTQYDHMAHPITGLNIPTPGEYDDPENFAANLTPEARSELMGVARDGGTAIGKKIISLDEVISGIDTAPNLRGPRYARTREEQKARAIKEQNALLYNLANPRTLGPALRQIGQDHQRESAQYEQESNRLKIEQHQQEKQRRSEVEAATKQARADLERQYGPYREVTDNEALSLAMQRLAAQGTVPIDEAAAQQPQNAAAAQTDGDVPLGNGDPNDYQQTPNGLFMVDPSTGQMKQADVVHGVAAVRVESMAEEQALPPGTHFYRPGEKSREVHIAKPQAGASGDGAATGQQDAKVEFAAQEAAQKKVDDTIGKEYASVKGAQEDRGAFMAKYEPMAVAQAVSAMGGLGHGLFPSDKIKNDTVIDADGKVNSAKTAAYVEAKKKALLGFVATVYGKQVPEWAKPGPDGAPTEIGAVSMSPGLRQRIDAHDTEQQGIKSASDDEAKRTVYEKEQGVARVAGFVSNLYDAADPAGTTGKFEDAMSAREQIMQQIDAAKSVANDRYKGTHGDPKRTLGAAQRIADMQIDRTVIPGSSLALPSDEKGRFEATKLTQAVRAAAKKINVEGGVDAALSILEQGGTLKNEAPVDSSTESMKAAALKGDSPEMASARRVILKSGDRPLMEAWNKLTQRFWVNPNADKEVAKMRDSLGASGSDLVESGYTKAEFDPSKVLPSEARAAEDEAYAKKGTTKGAEDAKRMAKMVAALPRFADGTVSLPGGVRVGTEKIDGVRAPVARDAKQAYALMRANVPQASMQGGKGAMVHLGKDSPEFKAIAADPSPAAVREFVDGYFSHFKEPERISLVAMLLKDFNKR